MNTAHPFELSGMGTGPYRFVTVASFPSGWLGEANPAAYQAALAGCAEIGRGVSGGLGTCRHCGRPITHNCIVADSAGTRYAVGSECVSRTGDESLGDPVRVAVARAEKEMRRLRAEAARVARHEAWLDSTCATGETNRARLDREAAAQREALVAAEQVAKRTATALAPIAAVLRDGRGGFRDSVATEMDNGRLPAGRGLAIALDVYAKEYGRRGSRAYAEAVSHFAAAVGTAPA